MKYYDQLRGDRIEKASAASKRALRQMGAQDKESLVVSLMLEELLLIYRETFGENTWFKMKLRRTSSSIECVLRVRGESFDALSADSMILDNITNNTELAPSWTYRNGCNYVTLSIPLYNTAVQNMQFAWKYSKRYRVRFFIAIACQWISIIISVLKKEQTIIFSITSLQVPR